MKNIFCVLSFVLFFLTSISFAGTINLPRTGQTKCYDTAGLEIPCAGTGQDGEIQAGVAWPSPRFTVNVDNTIIDKLTGLVWVSSGNLMNSRDPGFDHDIDAGDGRVTWQHALDYVGKLNGENYLGYSDWRLPNVNELESLVNAGEANIATWLNAQGFINVQNDYYWSSTSDAFITYAAWTLSTMDGEMFGGSKFSDHYVCYVWPVRSGKCESFDNSVICLPKTGQSKCCDSVGNRIFCADTGQDGEIQAGVAWTKPRFVDLGNTVTDNLTGLMWTKDANLAVAVNDGRISWQSALDYVKGMNDGTYSNLGYTDWRLPNRKELQSLIDFSQYFPALPAEHPFTNVWDDYWSSTSLNPETDGIDSSWGAWHVIIFDGTVTLEDKGGLFCVWPVRGGQVESTGCSTWTDVMNKYNTYVNGQASWSNVITCYNDYVSP